MLYYIGGTQSNHRDVTVERTVVNKAVDVKIILLLTQKNEVLG